MNSPVGAISFLLMLTAVPIAETEVRQELVVWNVGQGSWTTLVTPTTCHHFDAGGEFKPRGLRSVCARRKNTLSLTHWDRDHIQFVQWLARNLFPVCARSLPVGDPQHTLVGIAQLARSLEFCFQQHFQSGFMGWDPTTRSLRPKETLELEKTSNSQSQVFEVEKIALIPGDSGTKEEQIWASQIRSCPPILVLGHHGSRTSTSEVLLSRLRCLKHAISSSRRQRYGHPHPTVVQRLRKRGVPTLTTEQWGHLRIEL